LKVDTIERILILRICDGDAGAFSEWIELCWVRLVGFARSVVGDSDAEDIVQDSLVIAWEKLPSLRIPEAFHSWVLQIIFRACLRRKRRLSRFLPLMLLRESGHPTQQADTGSVDVEKILGILPPGQRAVMHLTFLEGMSDSEIGLALGIAAASVRSHRRRARETLQRIIGQKEVCSHVPA
jgi:RNA polymerase sigma-70 factor, ECF subfamily